MAKQKPQVEVVSYGVYRNWDANSKTLPKIQQFTLVVPAQLDIEFGFIVNIKKAKNSKVRYCIYHPDIPGDNGDPLPPFDGEEFVKSNDWDFYLGDTLWEPVENKTGDWRMTLELNDEIIVDKTFVIEEELPFDGAQFWNKHRGKRKTIGGR